MIYQTHQQAVRILQSIPWRVCYGVYKMTLVLVTAGVLGAKSAWGSKPLEALQIAACVTKAVSLPYHPVMMSTDPAFLARHRKATMALGVFSNLSLIASLVINVHELVMHHGEDAIKDGLSWALVGLSLFLFATIVYGCWEHHAQMCLNAFAWTWGRLEACARFLVAVASTILRGIDSAWHGVSSALGDCVTFFGLKVKSMVNYIRPQQPVEAGSGHNA